MLKQTLRLDISPASIATAARILQSGGLVAVPTETVYGLAANALDPGAVARIFAAKERPNWDPLIVHIDGPAMLPRIALELSTTAQALAAAAWPGPLTMLLPRAAGIPDAVTAGRPLVGVRWTAHPVARAVIAAAGLPLAAPSANRFGHISPTTAEHVLQDLDGRIDAVLDAGPTNIGLESTVLDPDTDPITIYRQGALTAGEVRRATGRETVLYQPIPSDKPESLPSPGVGIRHYAPRTPLHLVHSHEELQAAVRDASGPVGVLQPEGWTLPPNALPLPWGDWDKTIELAHNLYAALRALDSQGASFILAPLPDPRSNDDLRAALRDRLLKAAMPPKG